MKKKHSSRTIGFKAIPFCFFLFLSLGSFAQCDTTASICGRVMGDKFISDGQEYRALLISTEVAEFRNIFYGGSTYRLVAGSGAAAASIVIRILDKDRNILYNSADFNNPQYWDFKFNSTLNCTIEAQLAAPPGGGKPASGCAVLLIGFKN